MKKIVQLIIIIAGCASTSYAQDMNTYNTYLLNWFNVNPAYTGETEGVKTILNPGTQWVGLDGSPTSSMVGIHTAVRDDMGLGGKMIIDKRGVFTNFSTELNYAYKFKLNDLHRLSFGITAGVYQSSINANNIIADKYTDGTDPVATTNYYNKTHFLSSFGVLYQFKGLELGVSTPHLVVSGNKVSDHVFMMGKYKYTIEQAKLDVIPSIVYQNLTVSPNQLDAGLKVQWNNTIWAQGIYRTNKTIAIAGGVNFNKVNVGYVYLLNQAALSVISKGSHEVYIAFIFNKRNKSKKIKNGAFSANTESDNSVSRLSSILKELSSITDKKSISDETKAEITSIQNEISSLVNKSKKIGLTSEDEGKITSLEARIKELNNQMSK